MLSLMLALSALASAPIDPLTCFVPHRATGLDNNVSPGTYQLKPGNNVTACASLCLNNATCKANIECRIPYKQ